jgi:hypothetical protein
MRTVQNGYADNRMQRFFRSEPAGRGFDTFFDEKFRMVEKSRARW